MTVLISGACACAGYVSAISARALPMVASCVGYRAGTQQQLVQLIQAQCYLLVLPSKSYESYFTRYLQTACHGLLSPASYNLNCICIYVGHATTIKFSV